MQALGKEKTTLRHPRFLWSWQLPKNEGVNGMTEIHPDRYN
jgi:hypothetical protein